MRPRNASRDYCERKRGWGERGKERKRGYVSLCVRYVLCFTCILLPLGYMLMGTLASVLATGSLEILSGNFYKEERSADYSRRTSVNVAQLALTSQQ